MADKNYKLEFTLSDGTVIDAGTFAVPPGEKGEQGAQGEQGPKGEPGVSITGATITPIE